MKLKTTLGVFALLALLGMSACAPKTPSPEDVIRQAYMIKDFKDFKQYEELFFYGDELDGELSGIWNENTRNGTVTKIEILKSKMTGGEYRIFTRLHFTDTTPEELTIPLLKHEGKWRIAIRD